MSDFLTAAATAFLLVMIFRARLGEPLSTLLPRRRPSSEHPNLMDWARYTDPATRQPTPSWRRLHSDREQ